jgi:Protein of unknown function (DUF551)
MKIGAPGHEVCAMLISELYARSGINVLVKSSLSRTESSVELPGVSERRPLAFPIETAPSSINQILLYSPLRGDWTIAVRHEETWFDRATGEEIQRPTHWMPLPEPDS